MEREIYIYKFEPEPQLVDYFLKEGSISSFSKGTILYEDNNIVRDIFMVLSGEVEVYYYENERRGIISIMNHGSVLGMTAFLQENRHAYTRCRRDSVIAFLSSDKLPIHDTKLLSSLICLQSAKLNMYYNRLLSLTSSNGYERLLYFLAESGGSNLSMGRDDLPVCIYFTKQELADLICVSREHVGELLKLISQRCRLITGRNYLIYYPQEIKKIIKSIL